MHAKIILGLAILALLAHISMAAKFETRQAGQPTPPCPQGWVEHPKNPKKCHPVPPCPKGWRASKKNSETCIKKRTKSSPSPPCPEGWTQSKRNPEKCRKVKDNVE
eukprot:maker-scaffold1503_size38295-snap-gene-0.2 protein:Tk05400 transcript:maker-scaffold1503_size38295-snap-gene-0.2-mRNA-1 annotation:"egf and low-density lipoprotein receptor and low density lipoprotein-receptor domain containing protein"